MYKERLLFLEMLKLNNFKAIGHFLYLHSVN